MSLVEHTSPDARRRLYIARLETDRERGRDRNPAVWQIVAEVAAKHGITVGDIMSERRPAKISTARREAMYRAYTETKLASAAIARMFKRDHSTILHAVNEYKAGRIVVVHNSHSPKGAR